MAPATIRSPLRGIIATATALLALAITLLPQARAEDAPPLTVFAAASLKGSLDDVIASYTAAGHPAPRVSYAATSALARQIDQGAPADVFLSADAEWMDFLQQHALIDPSSRADLLRNTLVLIGSATGTVEPFALDDPAAWRSALGANRLALARTDSVPAGKYAKVALTSLGVWSAVQTQLAQTDDVRQALMFVARGEAPLGIVYRTDALAEPQVRTLATFASDTHAPIVYPAAAVQRAGAHADRADFLAFLRSEAATAIFLAAGFQTAQ